MLRLKKKTSTQVASTMNWENFVETSIGGFEIYKFISEIAVHDNSIRAETVASLRAVNKSFRQHIDAEIPSEMNIVNKHVYDLYKANETKVQLELSRQSGMTPGMVEEYKQSLTACNRDVEKKMEYLVAKFGIFTVQKLTKRFTMHVPCTLNMRSSNLAWLPNIERDRPRFSATVHSFLMLASKNACELNLGKDQCKCKDSRGEFVFVPSGAGLLMRCSVACMDEKCVYFNSASGRPVQVATHDSHNPDLSKRETNFLHNVLIQNGIHSPFSRDCFQSRIGSRRYSSEIETVRMQLSSLRAHSFKGIKMMLLNTVSTESDRLESDPSFQVTTLQNLLGITQRQIKTAATFMEDADDVVDELQMQIRVRMKKFAFKQVVKILNQYLECEQISSVSKVEDLEPMLPGCIRLIHQNIVRSVENSPIESIYSTHVLSRPFTLKLLSLVACTLGTVKRFNTSIIGTEASNVAYSFISGICAGMDSSFNPCSLARQLQMQLTHDTSCSENEDELLKKAVVAMHVFDNMDSNSIQVRANNFKYKTEAEYRAIDSDIFNAPVLFEVEFKSLSKILYLPNAFNSYDKTNRLHRKVEAASELLASLGYKIPSFKPLPRIGLLHNSSKKNTDRHNGVDEQCAQLALWIETTVKQLCSLPETRCIAIDLLTSDNTALFIDCVDSFKAKNVDAVVEEVKSALALP